MLAPKFDARKTAIVLGKENVDAYTAEEISGFSAIFLTTGSFDAVSVEKLSRFAENGGKVLPDIFADKNTITNEEMDALFDEFNKADSFRKPSVNYITPSEIEIDAGEGGLLVMSEKLEMFPGWHVLVDGKEMEIFRANGVVSAFFVPEASSRVEVFYKPDSYAKGMWISVVTLILVIGFFVVDFFVRKR